MDASEQINELAAALAKAQGQITPAKFDAQNPHLKNRYTTLAAVWDVIRKPLSENGLAVVQVVTTEADGMFLLTRLMHSSGQFIQAVYPITAGDNRGVSSAQAVGSALTYARRYSLTALGGVVSDDDDDGNSAAQVQQARRPQLPAEQPKQAQPSNGQQAQADPPGFAVWADWQGVDDAIQWGLSRGVFDHENHARNAYAKCKTECKPANSKAMWQCWYQDVTRRMKEQSVTEQPGSEPVDPEWAAIDAAGVQQEAAKF